MILNSEKRIIPDDCNLMDNEGKTPLCYALYHNNIQFTKFLVSHGANINLVCETSTGNTPVHLAFQRNHLMIILIILQFGADLNKLNKL